MWMQMKCICLVHSKVMQYLSTALTLMLGGLGGETAPVTESSIQGQTGLGLPPPIHHQAAPRLYVASELQHEYFKV